MEFVLCVTCNMLCFKLDATKRAINFGGKKNSNFFALFTAKLISFRRCNQEKENVVDRKQFLSFVSKSWPHFKLKLIHIRRA